MSLIITGGRLIDPHSGTDREADVLVEDGQIVEIAGHRDLAHQEATTVVDASGQWVTPGLIDLHVHLREPGQEYKEDIESGSQAAVFGGFTTIVAMPNTHPVIDNAELVAFVARRGAEVGLCRVHPVGAVTVGQKGETLAPIAEMQRAGAVALSDDGRPVADAGLMRRALEYSQDFGIPVLTHAEEPALSRGGHMHEGEVSTRLGLPGIPRSSEDVAVSRDVRLAEYTGGRLHVCHVSTAGAVDTIRRAKERGVGVTAEGAPHHFSLTHEAVEGYHTAAKVNPPLREESDRVAVIEGLKDGTLDAIATDHAPHSSIEKDVAFADAAPGLIGLQTALPLALDLWREHEIPLVDVIARMTTGPARVLGLEVGRVAKGALANIAVIDPDARWLLTQEAVLSKSDNSPFYGRALCGRVELTILAGKVVYRRGEKPVSGAA